MKIYNFYAGPSYLNDWVINQISTEISKQSGLSMLERSHRGKEVIALFEESVLLVKHLMNLNDDFEIMFLHGGARLQNCMIPYNIKTNETAHYVDTGLWANNSYEDSCVIRPTKLAASSEDKAYSYIPKTFDWDGSGYLHITTNNTVRGTQFHNFDFTNKGFVVADMSSDILSRTMDFNQFGMIYAGLQKNMGTAGGALAILRKDALEDLPHIPAMLNYKSHAKASDGMLNTPPVFTVLASNIVLKWIEKEGGVAKMDAINKQKASLLYTTLENDERIILPAQKEDRSLMNVAFKFKDESLDAPFQTYMKEKGIVGLEGHRSTGGYRASIYNQVPLEDVEYLCQAIKSF